MNRKTFYINDRIIYNEISVQTDSINKFYEIHNPDNERIVAIPDGCIDIQYVWKINVEQDMPFTDKISMFILPTEAPLSATALQRLQ